MSITWKVHAADPPRAAALARAAGVAPITAQLLLNRGIRTADQARRFLTPNLAALEDPWRLPDMARGIARLRRAIAAGEPILIFSDSDVDGLTASVILYEALEALGAVVRAKVSNRIRDGYGLPATAVQSIARSSTKLVLLVDCGTNQPDAVDTLAAHGIDTLIVDHHVPLERCAKPHALINPHAAADGEFQELSSAGLALKITQALFGDMSAERVAASLDLAALGTLADCSRVVGENRPILSEGLTRIVQTDRPGLKRLCEATDTVSPAPEHVAQRLVPRLNASGRLGEASAVWHLLRRSGAARCEAWLAQAEAAHARTKRLHRQMMAQAQEQVNRLHFRDQFVMVVSRQDWHPGLLGPLASQLAQRYGRPAIAIAVDERLGVGSGRSIPLFNLLEALKACQGLLVRFGGHAQACGLTVDRKHLESFRAQVNQHARDTLGRGGLLPTRLMDLELSLAAVAARWVEEAARFAPFGRGNERPSVVIRNLTIEPLSPRKAVLSDGTRRVVARGRFSATSAGSAYDVVATPSFTEGELSLTVSDVRDAAGPWSPDRREDTRYTRAGV